MKKLLLFAPLIATIFLFNCKKKNDEPPVQGPDTNPPVIALQGSPNDTVSLNSTTYNDPGATATDNTDGNISAKIEVTGTINFDMVGEYRRYYNVKDAAGNNAAQITRYVYVKNDADYLVGTYNAQANCGATQTGAFVTTVTISPTVNNTILMSLGSLLPGMAPAVKVNGSDLEMPYENKDGTTYSGSGTLSADKKEINLHYSIGRPLVGNWNCSTSYKRQ